MGGLLDDIEAESVTAAEAFSILGNETRMAILRALWEADGPRSFTDLREAVAPEDAGNFSYHVGKLTDQFVRKTDEGYVLRFAGERVVRAVLAGTVSADPSIPEREIDERCAFCGGTVRMGYDDEHITVRCTECAGVVDRDYPEGTYMQYGFPPAGLIGRTREEAVDAAHVLYDSKVAPMMKGVCTECAGSVELSFDVCEDHDPDGSEICPACETRFEVWAVYECTYCGYSRRTVMWFAALNHPAVVAFCHEHGLDEPIPFRKLTADNAEFVRNVTATVLDRDPYRFRVTVPVGEDALVVDVDDRLDVASIERADPGAADRDAGE